MSLIYADFNKYDPEYRLILTCAGTQADLAAENIELTNGLELTFYMDDQNDDGNPDNLIVNGIVQYDDVNSRWVAIINWDKIRHESDLTDRTMNL